MYVHCVLDSMDNMLEVLLAIEQSREHVMDSVQAIFQRIFPCHNPEDVDQNKSSSAVQQKLNASDQGKSVSFMPIDLQRSMAKYIKVAARCDELLKKGPCVKQKNMTSNDALFSGVEGGRSHRKSFSPASKNFMKKD